MDWVLVTDDARWRERCAKVGRATGVTMKCILVNGSDDDDSKDNSVASFGAMLGLSKGGASLVRPNGYVARRSAQWPKGDAEARLKKAVRQVAALT